MESKGSGRRVAARPSRRGAARPAKFSRPDAASLAARPRLMSLLADEAPVTWVIGPAGAGKTSMLSAWCAARGRFVLWYRVDEQDVDPGAVFASLSQGFAAALPRRRGVLPAFAPEHLLDVGHFARRFARAFNEGLPPDALLVFDDCHAAGAGGAFPLILAALLHERRADVSVLVASRAAPPPVLLGSVSEPGARLIGWDDLRCNDDEARVLCRHVTGREPEPEQLWLADGWPAGLILLLRTQSGRVRIAADGGDGAAQVFDALAAAAFDALPAPQRAVLLATAYASRITPSLAEHCGVGQAARHLADLWRAHFFIERAAGEAGEPTYRCHPLLRAFLQARLAAAAGGGGIRDQCRLISAWHEALGEFALAAEFAAKASATEEAVRLFGAAAPRLLAEGRIGEMLVLVNCMPGDIADRHPVLLFWRGQALVHRDPPAGRALLERAHLGALAAGQAEPALLAAAALLESFVLDWDWLAARPWVDTVGRGWEQIGDRISSPAIEARVLACAAAAMFPAPDHPFVLRALARARELMQVLREPAPRLSLGRFLIGYSWWRGDARFTRRLVRELAPLASSASVSPVSAIEMLIWCGIAARSDGDRTNAARWFQQAAAISAETGVHVFDFHLDLQFGIHAVTGEDRVRAEALFAALESRVAEQGRAARFLMDIKRPGYLMVTGQIEAAMQASIDALHEFDSGGWVFGRATQQLATGQIAVLAGRFDLARACLAHAIEIGVAMSSANLQVLARLALAQVEFALGRAVEGERELAAALRMAREKGFRHFHPWWIPSMVGALLARALDAGIEVAYARFLVRVNRLRPPDGAGPQWPFALQVRVLGEFGITRDARPLAMPSRTPVRVLALLKVLAARGPDGVAVERLLEALWPQAEGDSARASFDVCLHRARRLLDVPDALVLAEGRLAFNPERVSVDLWMLERRTAWLDWATPSQVLEMEPKRDLAAVAREWLATYRGVLLADEPDSAWVMSARLRWDGRLVGRSLALAALCEAAGDLRVAQALYQRLLDGDPTAERPARGLVALLVRAGRPAEARRVHEDLIIARRIASLAPPGPMMATAIECPSDDTWCVRTPGPAGTSVPDP
jgi:LuxR family maltose regulon positive regulatory protein